MSLTLDMIKNLMSNFLIILLYSVIYWLSAIISFLFIQLLIYIFYWKLGVQKKLMKKSLMN